MAAALNQTDSLRSEISPETRWLAGGGGEI
jgi:hypothetical protein